MENDFIKSVWRQMPTEDKSSEELKNIIKERTDSLVKKIRRQLIIEGIAIIIFLIAYYDFFDGDKKPLFANAALVVALVFMIGHNVVAFFQMRSITKGENIEQLLRDRIYKMKMYVITSGILRLILVCSFLVFFTSVIRFTQIKYWILAGAILIFLLQMGAFIKIWNARIRRMREVISTLRGQ